MRRKTTKRECRRLLAAVLGLAALAFDSRGDSDPLNIRNSSMISGSDILLRELVHSPDLLPEGWGDRVVMKAPAPGKPQQYSLTTLAYALQQYPDMNDVALRGEINFTVRRDGVPLDMKLAHDAVVAFVEQEEQWKGKELQVECDIPRAPILVSPQGAIEVRIENFSPEGGSGDYHLFDAALYVDGKKDRTVQFRARVLALQEFWVAAQPLSRGQTVMPEDLKTKWLPADSVRRGFIPIGEIVAGLQVDRPVRLDQPLSRHCLQQPVCAQRGEFITVVSERSGLQIALRAKALGDGRLGENVLCMNEQSKRRLLVRMVGSKQATVDF
ncbi:MAG TPA: flagella basal body P-ring formation protein FlgA [Verrucomicrobia bacterium]|nr:MAG: flagella basal body P-ring formation protein FlgA [Lentisphaerae bacterium GWF2_57_35]HBA84117.1 flagella basal body P-ring formation protein FlgA [Verrucomicrobiota bacterium]